MIIYNRTKYKELTLKSYQKEKRRLQIELLKLQEWVIQSDKRLAIVFEGRDAAGKGATIKRFIENLIPKTMRVVELGVPTATQNRMWFGSYTGQSNDPERNHYKSSGHISFNLEGKGSNISHVTASFSNGDLSSIKDSINSVSSSTGIYASIESNS